MIKTSIRFFEEVPVRAVWDDESSKWWFCVSAWCLGKDPKTGLQAVEVMESFKPFDGCVNGVAFDVYNEYQYVTYGVPEVLRKIRKGLKESLT